MRTTDHRVLILLENLAKVCWQLVEAPPFTVAKLRRQNLKKLRAVGNASKARRDYGTSESSTQDK